MVPYRFNPFEMDLVKRLTFNVFLKNQNFTMNRWPIIYFGEFDSKSTSMQHKKTSDRNELSDYDYSRFDIDLLGCYIYPDHKEGFIEIYNDRIYECALKITKELNYDFELTRSLLQTIVLLHELGHWFSHYCFAENVHHRMNTFGFQTTEIKETIAQLSVLWPILNLSNVKVKAMKEIMTFLTENQSKPYQQYLKLGKKMSKKSTILNRYVKLLDTETSDLNYLLLSAKQPNPHNYFGL